MIDRKLFQKTFSTLHASPDTLSEVYQAVHEEEHKQPLHIDATPSPRVC